MPPIVVELELGHVEPNIVAHIVEIGADAEDPFLVVLVVKAHEDANGGDGLGIRQYPMNRVKAEHPDLDGSNPAFRTFHSLQLRFNSRILASRSPWPMAISPLVCCARRAACSSFLR